MGIQNFSGHTLGQYELRDVLGMGGMGVVYRGYQASLRREVAVKILAASIAMQTGYTERFTREAQTSAALEHPHIVPIYDYGVQEGVSFIAMRLLMGGTLAQRLVQRSHESAPFPTLQEIGRMLRDLANALDYAHRRGVVHRDIKTSNVMFDSSGSSYLVDFGIARLTEGGSGLTGASMTIGTPSYMAPEQWRGETVSPASDQYAMGVLLYATLTGKLPYEATTPYALMNKHVNATPVPVYEWRDDIPRAVESVLERALAKQAEDRYPSVGAFAEAFEQAIAGISEPPTTFFSGLLHGTTLPEDSLTSNRPPSTASVLLSPMPGATPSQPVSVASGAGLSVASGAGLSVASGAGSSVASAGMAAAPAVMPPIMVPPSARPAQARGRSLALVLLVVLAIVIIGGLFALLSSQNTARIALEQTVTAQADSNRMAALVSASETTSAPTPESTPPAAFAIATAEVDTPVSVGVTALAVAVTAEVEITAGTTAEIAAPRTSAARPTLELTSSTQAVEVEITTGAASTETAAGVVVESLTEVVTTTPAIPATQTRTLQSSVAASDTLPPTVTRRPLSSKTPRATATDTLTAMQTQTNTPSFTPTTSFTPTASPTMMPSDTYTPTRTATRTFTLTPSPTLPICPGVQRSRLVPGDIARVLVNGDTRNNRVRDRAGLGGNEVGAIAPGEQFTVLAGPVCSDNFAWYQVNYNGLIGWTVESIGLTYALEAVERDSVSNMEITSTGGDSSTGTSQGTCVAVTEGETRARTGPGTNYDIAGVITGVNRILVLAVARNPSGFYWYWLENGFYVRQDTVVLQGDCTNLPAD